MISLDVYQDLGYQVITTNAKEAELTYFGKLEDIIEPNYYGHFKITLFRCKWADITRVWGFKKDP